MSELVQYFEVAELIFCSLSSDCQLSKEELQEINDRFLSIVNDFHGQTHNNTEAVQVGKTFLPFTSISMIGTLNDRLMLHFTSSFHQPLFLIIDTKEKTARNYIEIEDAKMILDNDNYSDVKNSLHLKKHLNHYFKAGMVLDDFIENYEKELEKHKNAELPTGRECFEISL